MHEEHDHDAQKRYYSIGEVAELLSIKPSVIRYWEKEFPQLSMRKTKGGNRRFTPQDIEVLRIVHRLLHTQGFTLKGAKKLLQQEAAAQREHQKHLETLRSTLDLLRELRNALN